MEKRSRLQNFNRLPVQKPTTKRISNLSCSSSSSSAAASSEAPKGCLRFLLSSNSCSSSSSLNYSKIATKIEPKKSKADKSSRVLLRSKENEVPKKPLLQKSKSAHPQRLTQKQNWENNAKSVFKNTQRSKVSSIQGDPANKLKKGSEEFRANTKNRQKFAKKSTYPVEITSGCGSDSVIEDSISEIANCSGAAAAKTPPLEPSLSPEIQCQPNSKIPVFNSEDTPVCYGAGHLLSGVTDKRKCRRRGSLKGGFERTNLFDDTLENENVTKHDDLKDSPVPLPAEASVRWLISPCKEEGLNGTGSDSRNRCSAPDTLDYLSSPSNLCGNESSYVLFGDSTYNSGGSVCNVGNKSTFSDGSLNSGNIIQTPNSEVDLVTETLKRVKLSPTSEISIWAPAPVGPNENNESVSSWMSDNLSLSRMRISWRDGLVSRIVENDDCCCCLSDQEMDADHGDGSVGGKLMLYPLLESGDKNQENDLSMDNDLCPMVLDYEPCVSARGKEKLLCNGSDPCQESICTDGGGLVASDDSDWIYCHENHLFAAK